MKIINILFIIFPYVLFSQTKMVNAEYDRSSLHVLMINDPFMDKSQIIKNTFVSMPFPDKYNNHLLKERYANVLGNASDIPNKGVPGFKLNGIEDKINNYFKENKIANQLVSKWLNRNSATGVCNMDMIFKRGLYNATQEDVDEANMLGKDEDALKNSGTSLLKNTFVVVEYFEFIDNEKFARPAAEAIYAAAVENAKKQKNEIMREIQIKAAEAILNAALEKAKGYNVWTHSYLYQLEWDDSVRQNFFNVAWISQSDLEKNRYNDVELKKRIKAFNDPNLFNLKFVGKARATTLISNFKEERSESDQIKEATIRSVDKVYVKLQKKFDVFKTKSSFDILDNGKTCTAKIGMKEGLEGGEKFDVLAPNFRTNGTINWVKKGTIKVDKKSIWDNRFYLTRPQELDKEDAITATSFKGCKSKWIDMNYLIRQQK